MQSGFPTLLSPLRVGHRTFGNRVLMLPHGTLLADGDGLPTPAQVRYFAERAAGGAAAIVVGSSIVHPSGFAGRGQNALWKKDAVGGYKQIARAVHSHGALILSQLSFTGFKGPPTDGRGPLWAASPVPYVGLRMIPMEMGGQEIEEIIAAFVQAAVYIQEGDYDGVEVFAAQGYGLSQFLSPAFNKRTDSYGGSLENRLRIVIEILGRIRQAVSAEFLVGVRMNGADLLDGGLDLSQSQAIAAALEASGYVDYLNVSAAVRGLGWVADMSAPLAPFRTLAAGIRDVVKIPVVCATRIKSPAQAEEILVEGQADLVGLARALIADPQWVQKAASDRADDICYCLSCNQDCLGRILNGYAISCVQNPAAGKEAQWGQGTLRPAPQSRNVMVVGGGPAGMEAARIAAIRGHRVTIYEMNERLGGQVNLAARIPGRCELAEVVRFRERELTRLGVSIELNSAMTPDLVRDTAVDVVILATGSFPARSGFSAYRPHIESITGADLPHVLTSWDVLNGTRDIGERVLIAEEDPHLQACPLAEYLADQGKQVRMISGHLMIGIDLPPAVLAPTYARLLNKGVQMAPHTVLEAIETDCAYVRELFTGRISKMKDVDTIILIMGNVANNNLYHALKSYPMELHAVGDCVAPRLLGQAIYEGHKVGRAL